MRHYSIAILCLLFFAQMKADEINLPSHTDAHIFGHVTDKKSGEHLPYINILLKNTTIGTTTDATGHFSLKNIPIGKYTVIASSLGYVPHEQLAEIREGKTIELNFTLEEDALNLNEVVVTAGRTVQKRTEASVIVNTLNAKSFSTTQSTVLGEGLNYCTGLRYENDCQNCGFSQIRMNGLEGKYSQILINSRPVFSGLAGVYGLELIPANMLDRIEVVRGGGSVLYGSNAIAGTVNLILKDPTINSFEVGYNTSLIGTGVSGSNGPTADHNASFNASLVTDDHRTGIAVFGNMRDRKMYDQNGDGFSEIAPMKNTVIGARLFHRPSYRNRISLNFFNIRESRDGGNKQDYPLHERDVAEAVKHDMMVGDITYEHYLRESDMLSVFASAQYLDRDSYYGANQSLSDYGNTKDKTYTVGAQYKADLGLSTLIGGVEHTGSYLKDKKLGYADYENAVIEDGVIVSVPHLPNTVVSDQSLQTTGAFAQYEIKYGRAKFLAGTRIERYSINNKQAIGSDKSGNVFIPRASVMYDLTSSLQARVGVSRGYRAPQIFDEDLHIETSGSRQVIHENDPALKRENSTSYTASFDYNDRIGSVNTGFLIEGFYTILHNPFRNDIGDPDENGTVIYTRVNSENGATVKGVNLEVKLYPTTKLFVNLGFTVQTGRYKDGDDKFNEKKFFRTPNTYGFFTADWEFLPHFGLSATGNYTGKMLVPYFGTELAEGKIRDAGELRKSDAFFDAGLKLHYTMSVGKGVTLQWFGGMKNIFNSFQKDFDKGIERDPSYVYGPGLPRTVFVGLKIGNLL